MAHHLRAVWIVQRQDRGLGENVGGSKASGMLRIALNLRGAPHMAFRQDPVSDATEGQGSGKKQRFAGHNLLWGPDIRHDVLLGLARTGAQTRQHQRGSHELHKSAATDGVVPVRGLVWKLAG